MPRYDFGGTPDNFVDLPAGGATIELSNVVDHGATFKGGTLTFELELQGTSADGDTVDVWPLFGSGQIDNGAQVVETPETQPYVQRNFQLIGGGGQLNPVIRVAFTIPAGVRASGVGGRNNSSSRITRMKAEWNAAD